MKLKQHMRPRNVALDVIRITALYCVISVHFFLNNGFYTQPVVGTRMYIMTILRTMFMVCVPLFIMLTGYLMNKKELGIRYYFGITKTIGIYLLAGLACLSYQKFIQDIDISFGIAVGKLLNFTAAPYAWYIEMYIGLFLLIPFLNLIYHNLKTGGQKQALLLTMIVLTSAPSILNIYNFNLDGWWLSPSLSQDYSKIIPNWWSRLYPVTYYFIGCYLSEFKIKISGLSNLILFVCTVILFGTFNFYRSYGGNFIWGPWQDWGALPNVIMTSLLFILLLNINFENLSQTNKMFLAKISNLCLGGYLVSWIFDVTFYPILNKAVLDMPLRLNYYFIIVPLIFICSLGLSFILNLLYEGIYKGIVYFVRRCV